jgi:hypothetical protein
MGMLAVVDTFLVYKIAERYYNIKNIAFITSVSFAVMPMTWLLRMIMLESIQMPFILLAVLFAIHIEKGRGKATKKKYYNSLTFRNICRISNSYKDSRIIAQFAADNKNKLTRVIAQNR